MRKTSDVNGAKLARTQSGLALYKQIKTRTPDLLHAMQALYQLSYSPRSQKWLGSNGENKRFYSCVSCLRINHSAISTQEKSVL